MNYLQTYAALRAAGMDLVAQCHELSATLAAAEGGADNGADSGADRGASGRASHPANGRPDGSHEEQLVEKLTEIGMPEADAASLATLAETYFGLTNFSGRQRKAIAHSRRNRHGLATLEMIERYTWKAPTKAAAWKMREELCACEGSTAVVERRAASIVREWKRNKKRPAPERGVRRYQHGKLATLALTGSSAAVADMYNSLLRANASDPFAAAEQVFFGVGGGAARSKLTTTVVITLPEMAAIARGEGDELVLQLTNGAQMTGAEFVQSEMETHGCAVLVDPMRGPVNAYRTARFANDKQRAMALAENPTCAWPGCNRAGEECQFHHIEAWERGGESNAANFVTLCAYHNGVNDDDPNAPPRRGRIERIGGKTTWIPPGGGRG